MDTEALQPVMAGTMLNLMLDGARYLDARQSGSMLCFAGNESKA